VTGPQTQAPGQLPEQPSQGEPQHPEQPRHHSQPPHHPGQPSHHAEHAPDQPGQPPHPAAHAPDHPGQSAEQSAEPTAAPPASRTVVLLRHARSTANANGQLAGRMPGVMLDDTGTEQAARLVARLAEVPIARLVSSPVQRCLLTLQPLAAARDLTLEVEDALAEVDYGDWTGRPLADLGGEPLWRVVQSQPSAAIFPGGEGLAEVASRAVAAVRRLARTTTGHGALLICSHGDVIKALLADALGMHLDQFQRISVGPASVSVVRYTEHRTFVELLGESGSLAGIVMPPPAEDPAGAAEPGASSSAGSSSDAVPGGDPGSPARATEPQAGPDTESSVGPNAAANSSGPATGPGTARPALS
jgi:probable phosphomutase (TIGR03848 family)